MLWADELESPSCEHAPDSDSMTEKGPGREGARTRQSLHCDEMCF